MNSNIATAVWCSQDNSLKFAEIWQQTQHGRCLGNLPTGIQQIPFAKEHSKLDANVITDSYFTTLKLDRLQFLTTDDYITGKSFYHWRLRLVSSVQNGTVL